MNELLTSLSKWFSEKANSPLYWTYLGFFVAWNWKFFQIIFLEHESLFTTPRVEYLETLIPAPSGIAILDWGINLLWHAVPPVIFTYIAIMYLPRLHRWAFEIYLKYHFERKTMFQEQKAEHERKMAELTKREADAKKERVEQEQIIEERKTDEERWGKEFRELSAHVLFLQFKQIIDVIYENNGRTVRWSNDHPRRMVNTNVLAFAHSKGLINITSNNDDNEVIELTDKGRFFVSKYLERKG